MRCACVDPLSLNKEVVLLCTIGDEVKFKHQGDTLAGEVIGISRSKEKLYIEGYASDARAKKNPIYVVDKKDLIKPKKAGKKK